jgi:hypothetical protein
MAKYGAHYNLYIIPRLVRYNNSDGGWEQNMDISTRRRFINRVFIIFSVGCIALWLPTIHYGFAYDDFDVVPLTLRQFLYNPFILNGRPLWGLSYAVLPADPFVHRILNMILIVSIIIVIWRIILDRKLGVLSAILFFASVTHPSFVWSVTWIAQRNDLLVIVFSLLGLLYWDCQRNNIIFQFLASASKTPFVLHDLVYAYFFYMKSRRISAICLVAIAVQFIIAGYLTYYQVNNQYYERNYWNYVGQMFAPLIKVFKIVEGFAYVIAPFPAYATGPGALVLSAFGYVLAWACILDFNRFGAVWREEIGRVTGLSFLALLASLVFASTLRVVAPVVVFWYAFACGAIRENMIGWFGVALLMALNLGGIALNYRLWSTDCMSITVQVVCHGNPDVPVAHYDDRREELRLSTFPSF